MTANQIEAARIFKKVEGLMDGNPHIIEERIENLNPHRVAIELRKFCKSAKQKITVKVVSGDSTNLYVIIRKPDKQKVMRDLLFRCMMETDNESLYQEIYNALYEE